jgi:hypothetical protein
MMLRTYDIPNNSESCEGLGCCAAVVLLGCGEASKQEYAPYLLPTPAQHGTGERLGFFRDYAGSIWGLPLAADASAAVLACALTGWRGGAGELELLLRSESGKTLWHKAHGAPLGGRWTCRDPESSRPRRDLIYCRLTPANQLSQ